MGAVLVASLERGFGRIETAPNRVVEHSPGPNPQIGTSDWRAAMQSIEQWKPLPGYEGIYEGGERRREKGERRRGNWGDPLIENG